ncbi:hypothetical protein HZC09_06050, partial [Candidatus Micrarchaeota archaeon]|nr:hypothetical protein [Candidatus Micrarchaeota archaeon]
MKKFIVLLALVSFILSSFATSASFSFMGPSNRQGCQCDQIIYYAEIVNDEPNSRTFYLSVEGLSTAAFSYFVVPDVEVKSSSSEQVAIFVTPRCDAPPGNYNFAVKARTGSMVHSIEGVATVSDCHYLTMEITPPQKLCAGDTATYVISLKNEGNFPESGSISTNLNPQIYSLSETGFSLNPSQSKDFYLYVTPPAGMPSGNSGFKVLGRSQYTYREAVSSLNVLSCVDLKISVPASINAQAGEETRAKAEFTNTGSVSDTFLLSLSCPPFVSLKDYKINLNASQSASTQLVIYPGKENLGIYSCTIISRAQKYIKEFTAKTSINAQQFYTATLSTAGVQGNMVKAC